MPFALKYKNLNTGKEVTQYCATSAEMRTILKSNKVAPHEAQVWTTTVLPEGRNEPEVAPPLPRGTRSIGFPRKSKRKKPKPVVVLPPLTCGDFWEHNEIIEARETLRLAGAEYETAD